MPDFSVILAYDKPVSGDHLFALYNSLNEKFGHQMAFRCTRCRFDQLEHPQFSFEAVEAAASANMVLLGTTSGKTLPDAVKTWIERWLANREHSSLAFVGAVRQKNPGEECTDVHRYLHEIAAKAGITFFAGVF